MKRWKGEGGVGWSKENNIGEGEGRQSLSFIQMKAITQDNPQNTPCRRTSL